MSCFSTEELFEIVFYPLNFFNWISLISSLLFRYSIFKDLSHPPAFEAFEWYLVGTNGLEPSTSRLSGVRSNHLSYAPIY